MSKTTVLYIHVTGISSEVLKNLVLAGIKPALCDTRRVSDHATYLKETPSFFWANPEAASKKVKRGDDTLTIAELVQPVAEELNPLLGECPIVAQSIDELTPDILKQFSVVVASHILPAQMWKLQEKVQKGTKLLWVDSFGMHAACWTDLGSGHSYRPEKGKELLDPVTLDPYFTLQQMYQVPLHLAVNRFHKQAPPPSLVKHKLLLAYVDHLKEWPLTIDPADFTKFIRGTWLPETSPSLLDNPLVAPDELASLAAQAAAELIPVCSVLGGMVGNEVIKAISGKGTPANNTVLFDGTLCKGWVFLLRESPKK